MKKITFKTYFNDRLKQIHYHGHVTYPLYVQVTFKRKSIFFKSYYFELFSNPRFKFNVKKGGMIPPSIPEIIQMENDLIDFILSRYSDSFSIPVFKEAYSYFSKNLCDITEKAFLNYLRVFLLDKGMVCFSELLQLSKDKIPAYDLVEELKKMSDIEIYNELIENSFAQAPPYLALYGFVQANERLPYGCLSMMQWEAPATKEEFQNYTKAYFPQIKANDLIQRIDQCCIN